MFEGWNVFEFRANLYFTADAKLSYRCIDMSLFPVAKYHILIFFLRTVIGMRSGKICNWPIETEFFLI
jgi:hypothetical protein